MGGVIEEDYVVRCVGGTRSERERGWETRCSGCGQRRVWAESCLIAEGLQESRSGSRAGCKLTQWGFAFLLFPLERF